MTFRTGIEWEIHELKFHGLNEKTLHYETNTVPTIIPDDFQILFGAPEVVVKDNKFSCSYWGTSWVRLEDLENHSKFAHKVDPYRCTIWSKIVRNQSDGNFHMKKLHKQDFNEDISFGKYYVKENIKNENCN